MARASHSVPSQPAPDGDVIEPPPTWLTGVAGQCQCKAGTEVHQKLGLPAIFHLLAAVELDCGSTAKYELQSRLARPKVDCYYATGQEGAVATARFTWHYGERRLTLEFDNSAAGLRSTHARGSVPAGNAGRHDNALRLSCVYTLSGLRRGRRALPDHTDTLARKNRVNILRSLFAWLTGRSAEPRDECSGR